MSEWWTYRLSDFLMFSAQTYERLLGRQHEARWPLQPVVMLALLALLALAGRTRRSVPLLLGALALAWAWVAADFLALRYARIYLGAPVMAGLFALQALLLAALCVMAWRRATPPLAWAPRAAAAVVLLAWPLVAPFSGRPSTSAEWVGFTPDPTAVFTLCLLPALCGPRWAPPLSLLPLATCAAGSATLHLLQLSAAWLPLVAAIAACATGWAAARR
jgi:hypothetical protein